MAAAIVTRHVLLGAALISAVLPGVARAQPGRDPASQEPTEMRVRFTFNDQSMTAALYDNPSARDFYSMLPLDLTIDNYAQNEKIAYLPRKLTEEGAGPFDKQAGGRPVLFRAMGEFGPLLRRLSLVERAHPPRAFRGWT